MLMDSAANFHHHQQQDHQLIVDSSFSWPQNPILNGQNININSRNNLDHLQSMGYPLDNNFMTHDLQTLARIKDEFSIVESYPKFLELLNCNPNYSTYSNNNQDFLLPSYNNNSTGQFIDDNQNSSHHGTFSQIFPTISISSTTSSSSSSTSSFDINCLPALEYPFVSPRFDGKFSHLNNLGGLSYGFDNMRQLPNHRPSVNYPSSKVSSVSTTGSTDQSAKRPASKYIDAKETNKSVAPKKSKSEPRASSAPFQVRKEKLGDRIAAIQQLVAPFGKTDTASVLMEAIGYIKFLQTQVETLSVPYMKSTNYEIGGISSQGGQMEDGNIRVKRDLRSRGLCLVPVSCLSYVTDGCEGFWPAP